MQLAASDIEKHAGRLNNRNNLISLLIKPPGEMIGTGGAWPGNPITVHALDAESTRVLVANDLLPTSCGHTGLACRAGGA